MNYIARKEQSDTVILIITREKSLNSLNVKVLEELDESFDKIDTLKFRSVIITGAGKKAFVAGADIACMEKFTKEQAADFARYGAGIFSKIETFPIPVIAAVNGYALGGGLELALACDIRIASENAVFGLPELGFGIIPGFGGTQRLMRTIQMGSAKEMIYTSKKIDAVKAQQLGLVNEVCKREALLQHAIMIAERISRNAAAATQSAKQAMNEGIDEQLGKGLELEATLFSGCFEKEEQQKRMQAFLRKS